MIKAFIFARGGSKGIPEKNLAHFGNTNLLAHSISVLCQSPLVEEIIVSTDSTKIAEEAQHCGAKIIKRPAYLASDTANEVDAWKHACSTLALPANEPFFVTPVTSPFRAVNDLDAAYSYWQSHSVDIIMSRKSSSRNPYLNMITHDKSGHLRPLSSDSIFHRRQDAPLFWDILTVLYLTTYSYLCKSTSLLQGNVGWIDIPDHRSIDIDTPFDLTVARLLHQDSLR